MSVSLNGESWSARSSPELVWEQSDDEVILINLSSGFYFAFNRPASEIWASCLVAPDPFLLAGPEPGEISSFLSELQHHELVKATPHSTDEEDVKDFHINGVPTLTSHSDLAEMLQLDPIHDVDSEVGWPSAPGNG
jgi:hypothetical protein